MKFIGMRSHPGWTEALPHYRIKCDRHGIVYTYPMGHNETIRCPICAGMQSVG